MILTIETALRGVADMLRNRIAPAIDDNFAGETARLAELMLILNAGWVDDAVAIRVAENAEIRALFAEAATVIEDPSLAARVAEAMGSRDRGLKISELDAENNRLRDLLVELHAHAEDRDAVIGQRIWRLFEQFEMARAPR